jgi:hypothetical protein
MDLFLQGDFESCADISTCDRTPQKVTIEPIITYTVRSFEFILKVGVEKSIMNTLYGLRIMDQLLKSYVFTRVVRSQSTLQGGFWG